MILPRAPERFDPVYERERNRQLEEAARDYVSVDPVGKMLDTFRIRDYGGQILDIRSARYRAKCDGSTNDTAAITAALTDSATDGIPAYIPAGTTMATSLTIPSGARLWLAPGAVLRRVADTTGVFIAVYDSDDVEIVGGTVDGNRANYTDNLGTLIVAIRGNATNVRLSGVTLKGARGASAAGGASGDGMYIARGNGTEGTNGAIPADIKLDSVVCKDNVRQGMTIVSVRRLKAVNCDFIEQAGTDPGAGVDIEPNNAADVVEDVEFVGCTARDNDVGFQIANAIDADVTNVFWRGGLISDNTVQGCFFIEVRGPHGVTDRCMIRGNGSHGIQDRSGAFLRIDADIWENTGRGIFIERDAQEPVFWEISGRAVLNGEHGCYVDPAVGGSFASIHDFFAFNNGTAAAATYDGVHLNSASATINWRLTVVNVHAHNLAAVGTAQQRYGVRAPTGVQGCKFSVNASGNGTGQLSVVDMDLNVVEDLSNGTNGELSIGAGFIRMAERAAAPAAPAANAVVRYAIDNGAGKTQTEDRFNTGANQVVATQP